MRIRDWLAASRRVDGPIRQDAVTEAVRRAASEPEREALAPERAGAARGPRGRKSRDRSRADSFAIGGRVVQEALTAWFAIAPRSAEPPPSPEEAGSPPSICKGARKPGDSPSGSAS